MSLVNAKDTLLTDNPGTLPNMQQTLLNWFQVVTFTLISKSIVDHLLVESETPSSFLGVRQPMKPQMVAMKPEGQRSWKWETIHAHPDLVLKTDDVMVFFGIRYRVMEKLDWKEYGYVEYHIVQDYTP